MKNTLIILLTTLFASLSLMQNVTACPDEDVGSKKMVENFLTNPNLYHERQQTGTSNIDAKTIMLVTDQITCQKLNQEFTPYKDDYKITYYKAGNFYFVTQIIKQPDEPHRIVTGLSFIYIYDENLSFVEGYSG